MPCCLQSLGSRRRYLVGDLGNYSPTVRALFEICITCRLKEDQEDSIFDVSRHDPGNLFVPLPVAPFYGRQTFRMWRASFDLTSLPLRKNTELSRPVKKLHFLPLEAFHLKKDRIGDQTFVQFVCQFLRVFFSGLEVNVKNDNGVADFDPIERRHRETGRRQFLVSKFYTNLHSVSGLPNSEYIVALTWTDLYPSEELNFVLGEASHWHKCGIFSFGRFEPQTFDHELAPDEESDLELTGDIIWKMLRVATHETCHLFRLKHCVFFSCAMNASGSVTEATTQPMFLCPICLRKLQRFLGFGITERYRALLGLCEVLQEEYPSEKMGNAIEWLQRILQFLHTDNIFEG